MLLESSHSRQVESFIFHVRRMTFEGPQEPGQDEPSITHTARYAGRPCSRRRAAPCRRAPRAPCAARPAPRLVTLAPRPVTRAPRPLRRAPRVVRRSLCAARTVRLHLMACAILVPHGRKRDLLRLPNTYKYPLSLRGKPSQDIQKYPIILFISYRHARFLCFSGCHIWPEAGSLLSPSFSKVPKHSRELPGRRSL